MTDQQQFNGAARRYRVSFLDPFGYPLWSLEHLAAVDALDVDEYTGLFHSTAMPDAAEARWVVGTGPAPYSLKIERL